MSKNLLTRIIVAIIFIPAILWISYQGGWWLFGMLLLFALLSIIEFLINEDFKPNNFLFWLALVTVLLLFAHGTSSFLIQQISYEQTKLASSVVIIPITVTFFLISSMFFGLSREDPAVLFVKHSSLLWGVIYIGLLYPIVFKVGLGLKGHSGGDLLLFLFGILWVGDTFAKEIGERIGKNKLAPSVSPNKTIEGFVGGLIGALLIGIVMHFWKFPAVSLVQMLLIAFGCSIFGQLGDLVKSMWKRSVGIKDSSKIIPGHGGVIDRFDSLLFAAPYMYFYFLFFLK